MAVDVKFYIFPKKINSTKQPDGNTVSVTYSCNMLDDCSIISPKISIVGADNTFNPSIYNYAYIADFDGRFYFVSDWVYSNRIWNAVLTEDVLASWKGSIGNSKQYILRSSDSTVTTDFLTDGQYPALGKRTTASNIPSVNNFSTSTASGTIIIGVTGKSTSTAFSATGANYYAMTPLNFMTFMKETLGDTSFLGQVVNGLTNPIEYVVSCQWFPIKYESIDREATTGDIYFGWWAAPTTVSYKQITGDHVVQEVELNFTTESHPQIDSIGSFLQTAPYTQRAFVWPPVGTISIDTTIAYGNSLNIKFYIDLITGGCNYFIKTPSFVHSGSTIMCVNMPLTQNSFSLDSVVKNVDGAIVNTTSLDFAGLHGNIIDGFTAMFPSVSRTGTNSSFSAFLSETPKIISNFSILPETSAETYGKPVCKYLTISNLIGYIQTGNAHIDIAATDQETDKILSFMNGGFYYE